ncbi:MAG: ATP-binding protein [Polyangiales bacterium]
MSLARRVWVLLTVPVVLCVALYGAVSARFHRAELVAEAANEVRETGTALGTAMSLLPPDIEAHELHAFAERLTRDTRVLGIGVYDPQGRWLGGSRVAASTHAALGDLVEDALRRRRDFQETRVVDGRECLARVELITPGAASPAGAVLVLRDLGYVRDALRRSSEQLVVVAVVMALVMAAAAWRIARWLTEPAERFLAGVARVSAGDLDAAVPEEGAGEFARLGGSFNRLTGSLREARARLADEEAARSQLEAELRRAQMLAVAGQVAATLAHEIGSPLSVILGRARMNAERDDLDADTRATFTAIAAQCERISRVMSQFLSLTRPAPEAEGAAADASVTAREVVAFLGHECRRAKVRAEVVAPSPVRVPVGHDRLFQVLFNLCINALHAQSGGGRLRVRVAAETERREGFEDRAMACVEVADAGGGVPEALRGKVFDPFFSTRHASGGTGLGLAVVAGIVRDRGGRVTVTQGDVDDPELKGAVFRVWLPLA